MHMPPLNAHLYKFEECAPIPVLFAEVHVSCSPAHLSDLSLLTLESYFPLPYPSAASHAIQAIHSLLKLM